MKHTQGGKHGVSRIAGAVLAGLMLVAANGASGAEKAAAESPKNEEMKMKNQWVQEHLTDAKAKPPFSFVFDGKASEALLSEWPKKVDTKKLDASRTQHIMTWTDPKTGLVVRCVAIVYQDYPVVEWTVHFTNTGDKDSPILEQVMGLDAAVAPEAVSQVVLHRLNGSPCGVDDWMPFDQPLAAGKRIDFAATAGRSSNVSPWFNVDWGNGGTITAIGWSGQWCASVEFKDGQIRTRAGMQNLRTVLHPGESVRSARILQLHWQGGDQFRGYNLFRQAMLTHIMPRIGGQLVVPPIVHLSTSFYELNDSNEKNVLSHLESIKGLGFEMFWLDAYWTGPNGFPNSMGNYGFPIERVEPKDRFPNGLKVIGDAVEAEGLGFVLWFEPERVASGTFIAKEHPEWVINSLFNLGIPEARRFMTDYLNAAIKAYKVSCLRIDYNIDPLGSWQAMDAKDPSRTGMTEMRYVEGLYQMWDDILRANPKLFIDNCASGGRRIDLETMSRSIPLWRSDNTCDMLDKQAKTIALAAIKNQLMSGGLNRYVPFSTVGQMGATPYLFRSGFNAGIDFCEDVRPKDYPRDLLKLGIAEGKRIRKYFFGNFYPLVESGHDASGWCVLQYHRPAQGDGIVMAFRREQAPDNTRVCELREIDPAASYRVTLYRAYEPEAPLVMKGADLQKFKVVIDDRPGSVIVEYCSLSAVAKVDATATMNAANFAIPATTWTGAVRVNCGGPAADGLAADQAYRIGSWGYVGGSNFTAEAVSNAPGLPVPLQTYRASKGTFEYRFDLPRGVYNVILHFAEPVFSRAGDRRFNVWINGVTRLMDYDLYADAGGRNKAVQKEYDGIAVLDGQLVVRFGAIGGTNQTALVQAIEVRQDTKAQPVTAPAPDPAVRVQSLDGQWQIAKDPGWAPGKDPDQVGIGRAEKWYTPDGFPLAASRPIQVPGHIWEAWRPALVFPFVFQGCENGVYWYVRSFVAAMPKAVDMRYFLRFGNCEYSCEVWLNGKQVGSHVGASASFEFDVTDALLPGDNFVALRVFSPGGILGPPIDGYPNGTGYAAFSGSGGLQQSVVLQARPQVRIEDVFARPDWKTGNLPLEVMLDNRSGSDAEVTLKAVITERKSGKEVASVTASVRAQPGQSVHALATTVTPVRLWSPDDPFLYAVKVTADWAGKRDAYEIPRVGFRELRVVNGVFMFNGKRFYPKCMHGVPISEDTYLRTERNPKALIPDFVMIKNAGFNMYRPFAHAAYPSQLDQADELGFLIYNEHPGTCWNVPVHRFGLDLPELIRRARNHPSVVIWGLLNERGGGVWASPSGKPVTAAAVSMLPALRKVDDTRLFLLDSGSPGMSNPGSTTWDVQMNDYHLYPAYPLPWGGVGGVQGGFCSEGSIGSSWNPYASRRIRQRLGAANDELCAPLVNSAIQWIEDVWKRYGLSDTYPDPAAMFVDSERLAAHEREVFFNSMRSNPGVTGYSMTSLGDNYGTCGGWGEGILNSAHEFKADHLPVLQAGWAKLGWTVLVNPRHAYAGQPVHVKVGMFNEDQLAPGSYPARFTIAGPAGEVWRKEATVTVPGGEKAPLNFGVLEEDVTMPGLVEGRYTLAATLVGVTNVAGGRLEFTVTQKEKHADLSKTTLTVLGLDPRIKELLTSRGATLREFQAGQTFDREAIVVGMAPDVATWRALYQHIARGAHAILLSSDTRWFALPSSGKGTVTGGGAGWLYRQEIIARNHPIFRDMPAKVLMPDYYGPLLNGEYFNKIVVPDESVVIRLWCTLSSRGEMGTDGVIVGTYRHHAGKFTVNAFNLLGNLGMPAADRMLLNMASHAAATAAPLQPLPEKHDEELDKLGIK